MGMGQAAILDLYASLAPLESQQLIKTSLESSRLKRPPVTSHPGLLDQHKLKERVVSLA